MKNKPILWIKMLIDLVISSIIFLGGFFRMPKKIWIIAERPNQAQDNGIAFFKYMCENHTDLSTYYLLHKNSRLIHEVEKIGPVLLKNSLKHKCYFLKSEVIAFTEKNMIEPWGSNFFYKYMQWLYPKKLKVFLQHGIIYRDISAIYGKAVSHIDRFVTSAREESTFIQQVFGYVEEEVVEVGLSRYDSLIQQVQDRQNTIFYMPTWRKDLMSIAHMSDNLYIQQAKQVFLESTYYKALITFLGHEDLKQLLSEKGWELVFVSHYAMDRLVEDELKGIQGERIKCYPSDTTNIQDCIKKSRIVITDYSSIHFDAAYINKQIIYYQFDQEMFNSNHSEAGYFDYEEDGFGEVVTTQQDLMKQIRQCMEQTAPAKKYITRANHFFSYRDNQNCKRLYDAITHSLGNRKRR